MPKKVEVDEFAGKWILMFRKSYSFLFSTFRVSRQLLFSWICDLFLFISRFPWQFWLISHHVNDSLRDIVQLKLNSNFMLLLLQSHFSNVYKKPASSLVKWTRVRKRLIAVSRTWASSNKKLRQNQILNY